MQTGIVKKWFPNQGFGFIVNDQTAQDVFVHARDLLFEEDSMSRGLRVRFMIGERHGKVLAWNVQKLQ